LESQEQTYSELSEEFISLVFSPNPLRDNVKVIVDGEDITYINRDRFIELLKTILDYSNPKIKESISVIELFMAEYGGWMLYDRPSNTCRELQEEAAREYIHMSSVRKEGLQADYDQKFGIGMDESAMSRFGEITAINVPRKTISRPTERYWSYGGVKPRQVQRRS
jgi:hypothetical protein